MNREQHSIRVTVGRPAAHAEAPAGRNSESECEPRVYLTPPIDIHEGPDGLVLEADLPGADEQNVSIQLEDNVLSLHAKMASPVPSGASALYEEYHVGDFYRSFILSDEVERGRITAELQNGVLRLTLPKAERAKSRRIEIKS